MIRNILDLLKNNKGFIIVVAAGLFALISIIFTNATEMSDRVDNQPPLSAPTSPTTSPEDTSAPSDIEPAPVDEFNKITETEDLETLMSDLAADAAMTVISVGFSLEYDSNPEERLSRIRSITNTEVYNYFVRYYNSIDWAAANREKIEIFADIEEMNFLSYSSTGTADIEVKARYYGDNNKTIRNKDEEWFIVEVTRVEGLDGWVVSNIQERP
jgi:hypothetical protein